jgi:hypothetical protein
MGGFLDAARSETPRQSAPLKELERVTVTDGDAERVLAVAERADGARVLCREVERTDKDTKVKTLTLKQSAMLRDFALAIDAGLL